MSAQDQGSEDSSGVVKSAVRTLEILEYFDEVRHPLNVVGVATGLGYPQSSTAALLRSLTSMGYLRYNRSERTYMPTDRVPFLGSWIDPPLFEEAALPRLMRAVGARTGQLVTLAARNNDAAQYIHVLNEPTAVSHHIKIGQKRPLATSGVGHVLLCAMADNDVKRLFHRINAYAESPEARVDFRALTEQLKIVRGNGYAFTRNRVVEGYGMIALAIPNSCTSQPLALGVGGLCETLELRKDEILRAVREEMATYLKVSCEETTPQSPAPRKIRIPAYAAYPYPSSSRLRERVA